MTLLEAIEQRHSVRQYTDQPLSDDIISLLQKAIDECNEEGDLHIQLVTNEPKAFDSRMAHYGKFSNVRNYFALVGKKASDLEERCGYYGEKLVLYAQTLGLNTCWVALTYKKIPDAFVIDQGEKLVIVIALGYGANQGVSHKSKKVSDVLSTDQHPQWLIDGMQAAMLAPTAMNQQKFKFIVNGNMVKVKPGLGVYTKTDLGIVKYHFEVGAGKDNFIWEN